MRSCFNIVQQWSDRKKTNFKHSLQRNSSVTSSNIYIDCNRTAISHKEQFNNYAMLKSIVDGGDQRTCILENIGQEIYAKIGVRVTVHRQL